MQQAPTKLQNTRNHFDCKKPGDLVGQWALVQCGWMHQCIAPHIIHHVKEKFLKSVLGVFLLNLMLYSSDFARTLNGVKPFDQELGKHSSWKGRVF